MASVLQANKLITEWLADDPSAEIITIEKAVDGRVTIEEISDSLREYANLFKAGYSSPAQTLTLHRAYPDNPLYAETVKEQDLLQKDPNVVGGPASVEMIDREGHLITTNALSKAFDNYMKNPMTRNVMVMHSDIQVGWALPAYISKSGQIYKSGIGDNTLFFITELRDDTKISKRVVEEIKKSRMKSYSIAGSAIRTENVSGNMFKGEPPYMRVDELELAEVTICEKGVNQGAGFDIIKGSRPTKSCADESCFISKNADHSHSQETKTMSFDEYKEELTSRDGKSFAKMFSEYTTVYKEGASPTMSNLFKADPPEGMEENIQRGIKSGQVDEAHWEEYKASKKDADTFGSYKPKSGPELTARRERQSAAGAQRRESYYNSSEGKNKRWNTHVANSSAALKEHFGIDLDELKDSDPDLHARLGEGARNRHTEIEALKQEHYDKKQQSDTDSDTFRKKAMKTDMLYTLLGLSKAKDETSGSISEKLNRRAGLQAMRGEIDTASMTPAARAAFNNKADANMKEANKRDPGLMYSAPQNVTSKDNRRYRAEIAAKNSLQREKTDAGGYIPRSLANTKKRR